MSALSLYQDRRIPKDHINFCVDYHIRYTLRPEFVNPFITERIEPLRGSKKYQAYADLIGENFDTVISVVDGYTEPTAKILEDMGIYLAEISKECWVLCPVVNRVTPATTMPTGAFKSVIRNFYYIEKSLPDS